MSGPIAGDVATSSLYAVLKVIAGSRSNGTLTVRGRGGTKKVFFHGGHVLAVASADVAERLGHYLLGWALVSRQELESLLEEQRHQPRGLGELVVARRLLDGAEMARLLRIRAEDALFDLARWQDGDYRFAQDVNPVRGYLEMRLPVEAFVHQLEALLAAWRRAGQNVPSRTDVPSLVVRGEFATLSMEEAAIVRRVDGRTSLAEIAMACRRSQLEVAVVLQNYAREGLLEWSEAPAGAKREEGLAGWLELLREAENHIVYDDLVEAYDLLCRALAAGDVSRDAVERALEVEERIRAGLGIGPGAVLRKSAALEAREDTWLSSEESDIVGRVDGRRSLSDVIADLSGDALRASAVAHALVQHGVLQVVAEDATAGVPAAPATSPRQS
jgi:hypothetical protein